MLARAKQKFTHKTTVYLGMMQDIKMKSSQSTATNDFSNRLIIYPNPNWFISNNATDHLLKFPPIHYFRTKHLDLPFKDTPDNTSVVMGGSYSLFCDLPLHFERCEIFENLHLPYRISTKHIRVRHGLLLWPLINMSAFTYLPDPRRVFLRYNNKFVIEFKFSKNHIDIIEAYGDDFHQNFNVYNEYEYERIVNQSRRP